MNGEGGERLLAGVELGRRRRSSRQRRVGWLGVGGKLRRDVSHVGEEASDLKMVGSTKKFVFPNK